jgi:hypothetical protein
MFHYLEYSLEFENNASITPTNFSAKLTLIPKAICDTACLTALGLIEPSKKEDI